MCVMDMVGVNVFANRESGVLSQRREPRSRKAINKENACRLEGIIIMSVVWSVILCNIISC